MYTACSMHACLPAGLLGSAVRPCRPVFSQILEALDHWLDGDVSYQPAWLGPCAATPAAQQEQQSPQQPPQQSQHNLQQVKCFVPGELLLEQQHRQWRDTMCHVSPTPHQEPQGANMAGRSVALQTRTATGQMDWSEVSFERLRHDKEHQT
jgi:hypothetical protein